MKRNTSPAAKEMKKPPPAIQRTRAVLWVQAASWIACIVVWVGGNRAYFPFAYLTFLLCHVLACYGVWTAARQLERRGWRYLVPSIIAPIAGPLVTLHVLVHGRDFRL